VQRATTARAVGALLTLRWQMLRTTRARIGATVAAGVALGLLVGGTAVAAAAPGTYLVEAGSLLPTVLLAFAVVTAVSGIATGGGTEIVPAAHLVAFPVPPRAVFVGSALLAPFNLAWTVQLLALVWVTSYVAPGASGMLVALPLLLLFVATATALGLALSWWVTGVRETRRGRRASELATAAVVGLVGWLAVSGRLAQTLDASPLADLVVSFVAPDRRNTWLWLVGLLAVAVLGTRAGFRATAWTLRRREDSAATGESSPVRRRRAPTGELRALVAIDRASVWRSRPIRRGVVVLGVAPGVAAVVGGMSWDDLAILPGLVASGAALLFGVNAFCLDGSGAAWLESTPRAARAAFASKARVTGEVVLVAVLMTILLGGLRAPSPPTLGEVTVVLAAAMAGTSWTVALAMRLSIRRPHKADLRGPRDTPAPPAAMTGYSARLAAMATLLGAAFAMVVRLDTPWPGLLLALALVALALRHLLVSARVWADDRARAGVVTRVAFG
jgi:hypothetical protein